MAQTIDEIERILKDIEVNYDNIFGVKYLLKDDAKSQSMLLEYLKSNKNEIYKNLPTPLLRGSIVLKHLTRIFKFLKKKICFDYYPPKPWEIIPDSQKCVIR